jgi:hydrogenase maturation protease
MTMSPVLVAGIGNVFAGDDGFGCEVARRLAGLRLPDGVRVVDYGIRGLHLAYDLLEPWDALILVDAVPDRGGVGTVAVIEISPVEIGAGDLGEPAVDAHGMDPACWSAARSPRPETAWGSPRRSRRPSTRQWARCAHSSPNCARRG